MEKVETYYLIYNEKKGFFDSLARPAAMWKKKPMRATFYNSVTSAENIIKTSKKTLVNEAQVFEIELKLNGTISEIIERELLNA